LRVLRYLSARCTLRVKGHHTSLTEWHVTGTRWTLARYNDTGHLLNKV
jgi:hypothetical protein